MYLRESSKRQQFERYRRMLAQTKSLQTEQDRSTVMLLNILPATIVKKLAVRVRHLLRTHMMRSWLCCSLAVPSLCCHLYFAVGACVCQTGTTVIADAFAEVTILYTDLCGFTEFTASIAPKDLVMFLNIMYSKVWHPAVVDGVKLLFPRCA